MLSCDECKENVLRKDMEKHLLMICTQYEIMCDFKQFGCNFRVKRTLMNKHLIEKEMEHLKSYVNLNIHILPQKLCGPHQNTT